MKKLKKILKYFYYFCLAFLILIAILVAISAFNLPNGYKLYTVQSGSMEPAIPTGSLVVSRPQPAYQLDDIITFESKDYTTTHRIVELKPTGFITKGDANDSPDPDIIDLDKVLGKTLFTIPYLGQPVSFAKTQTGFIILIVVPATIIVYSEILTIKNELILLKKKHRSKKKK